MQSQGLAQQARILALGPSDAHILAPIQDHPQTPGRGKRRASITVHGPELMDTTDLGQGHLYIVHTTQCLDLLKHLVDSLPLKAKYLREKKSVIVFPRYRHNTSPYDIKEYCGQSGSLTDSLCTEK